MGRKQTSKSKEKKMKRKEENNKLKELQALVDVANTLEDPMANMAPFKKFERNGLSITIGCHKATDLDQNTMNWAFELTKSNMQTHYESSDWGWSDVQKKDEMEDDRARYLIARDQDDQPVAVVHFRYDLDFDDAVLYCYEIQLVPSVRRKGLGKFLIQILELLSHKAGMEKVMCTVFNKNDASKKFFMEKLNYTVDETSPEESMVEALYDEEGYTYQILSKFMAKKAKVTTQAPTNMATAHTHSHTHNCCSGVKS